MGEAANDGAIDAAVTVPVEAGVLDDVPPQPAMARLQHMVTTDATDVEMGTERMLPAASLARRVPSWLCDGGVSHGVPTPSGGYLWASARLCARLPWRAGLADAGLYEQPPRRSAVKPDSAGVAYARSMGWRPLAPPATVVVNLDRSWAQTLALEVDDETGALRVVWPPGRTVVPPGWPSAPVRLPAGSRIRIVEESAYEVLSGVI